MEPANISRVFDTTQFNTNSSQQLAQHFRTFPSSSTTCASDRTSNVNITVTKDFHLFERVKLQYRAEASTRSTGLSSRRPTCRRRARRSG